MNHEKGKNKLSEMSLEELWHLFPIQLTPPNPKWEAYYLEMESRLKALLEGMTPKIHHIGSTAINGIWAKPIVDVLVELPTQAELRASADLLQNNGFLLMYREEKRIAFNLGYTEEGFAEKVYHIHLRLAGDIDEIVFRDYLNSHPTLAKDYEILKISLWHQYEFNREGYTDAKTNFIKAILKWAKRDEKQTN